MLSIWLRREYRDCGIEYEDPHVCASPGASIRPHCFGFDPRTAAKQQRTCGGRSGGAESKGDTERVGYKYGVGKTERKRWMREELTGAKVAGWRRRDRKHGSTAGRGMGETLRSIKAHTTPLCLASFRTSDDHQNPPESADVRPAKGVERQDAEDEIGDGPGEDGGKFTRGSG